MEGKEYKECYITFLDMLGFKKLISQSTCEEINIIFDNIKKPFSSATLDGKLFLTEDSVKELKIKVMSDSICFYIDTKCSNSLLTLLLSCAVFQSNLLKLSTPVLLRGAVVRGNLYAKDDVTFGQGLTQAYLMEENNAKYPRIILTNEVLSHARKEDEAFVTRAMEKNIIFRDSDAFYVLNYIQLLARGENQAFKRFQKKVEEVLDTTTDESIREKYLYLEKISSNIIP